MTLPHSEHCWRWHSECRERLLIDVAHAIGLAQAHSRISEVKRLAREYREIAAGTGALVDQGYGQ